MSHAARPLLIVEDDPAISATIVEQLAGDGAFSPVAVPTLADAEAVLGRASPPFDGILLDLGLPDGDGRDFCAELRRRGLRLPIIMLTGRDAEGDVVQGLEAGANDYVVKPFRQSELVARLRAQFRSFDETDHAVFSIGPYRFRPSTRTLEEPARNRKIRLTDLECRLLKRLYRGRGAPVSRQALMQEVWGYNAGTATHTLETHIYRLRQKLEPRPAEPRFLIGLRGGYGPQVRD